MPRSLSNLFHSSKASPPINTDEKRSSNLSSSTGTQINRASSIDKDTDMNVEQYCHPGDSISSASSTTITGKTADGKTFLITKAPAEKKIDPMAYCMFSFLLFYRCSCILFFSPPTHKPTHTQVSLSLCACVHTCVCAYVYKYQPSY